ncbi:MAG TPA: zinc ribbon domain-containing protein, partial [Ktedonobacterales bacterium]|nr:zinc ribbon domain-containing protein [Ktedonobacterales bacterium]
MGASDGGLICSNCHQANAPGTRYCVRCGEPVDPALVAVLQRLYTLLTELDAQIAAGLGGATVQSLRDTIRERYLAERASRAATSGAAAAMGASAPVTVPLTPASQPVAATPVAPVAAPVAPVAAAAAIAAPEPHGPVFSWRAFIAEQAIAVMAYLGGFLLLIATLTFEVGGWQALPDGVKLAGVVVVYLIFGLLGMALRRSTSLRTVGRVYLGVFALMTPLAALAVYRFELQSRGFPISGTVCLAAAYAAAVYLSLGARTRFVTYAYLGWAALLLSALAIPPWAGLITSWWIPVTTLVGLALLTPHFLRRRAPDADSLATLEPSATQFSAGLLMLGSFATVALGLQTAGSAFAGSGDETRAAFALAACALTALLAAWSRAARRIRMLSDDPTVAMLDWLAAASVALADVAVAAWLHASLGAIAYSLAVVALAEALAAEALRVRAPAREGLRIAVQVLAAGLIVIAAILAASVPIPDTPLIVACAVAVVMGLTFALRGGPLAAFPWGLFAGIFLLLGLNAFYTATIPSAQLLNTSDHFPGVLAQYATLMGYPAVALWALGLALKRAPSGAQVRRLRSPMQVTALLAAVVSSILLSGGHSLVYGALFLGVYALLALVVSRLERQPLLAGGPASIFASAGAMVFVITNRDGAAVAALPIGLALLTIILGRWLGRAYSAPAYVATLCATFFGFLELVSDSSGTAYGQAPLALGIGGWMALIVALALLVEALTTPPSPAVWQTTLDRIPLRPAAMSATPANPTPPARPATSERRQTSPLWMLAPAGATLLAVVDAHALAPLVALSLGLAGVGALLRQLRGAYWEPAWHGAALVASLVALNHASQDT